MKEKNKKKKEARERRRKRARAKIFGTAEIPRLNLYRSNKGLFIQIIDDAKGITLLSVSDREIKEKGTKTEIARKAGKLIAQKAKEKSIKKIVFDRNGYKYHGRVKAAAEGAREEGLEF